MFHLMKEPILDEIFSYVVSDEPVRRPWIIFAPEPPIYNVDVDMQGRRVHTLREIDDRTGSFINPKATD